MLKPYDFSLTQLRYIRAAMAQVASFRPGGATLSSLDALLLDSIPPRTAYLAAKTDLDSARADRRFAIQMLHDACIDFAAQARSTFRRNPNVAERLTRLPSKDQSFPETLARADATLALWGTLPQAGTPAADFTVKQGTEILDLAGFEALRAVAGAAHEAMPEADQAFQEKAADLHTQERVMDEVIQDALAQGRSQFAEGSAQREIIDAIPVEASSRRPGKAEITAALSPGPALVRLDYVATGATSFDIFERAPGAGTLNRVGEGIEKRTFELANLTPGPHEFTVRGRNARGLGPESEVARVTLPE